MKEGNVILTPVLQADGKLKERPAIFLREMPPYRDLHSNKISDSTRFFSGVIASSCAWFNWFHLSRAP